MADFRAVASAMAWSRARRMAGAEDSRIVSRASIWSRWSAMSFSSMELPVGVELVGAVIGRGWRLGRCW